MTLFGIVILVRLVHPEKALPRMLVTLFGTVILVRLVQLLKASSPMIVTGMPSMILGITKSPEAAVLQSVIVTSLPSSVQVRC